MLHGDHNDVLSFHAGMAHVLRSAAVIAVTPEAPLHIEDPEVPYVLPQQPNVNKELPPLPPTVIPEPPTRKTSITKTHGIVEPSNTPQERVLPIKESPAADATIATPADSRVRDAGKRGLFN
jgi:hypothetical protein